jgi:hypothetical protein
MIIDSNISEGRFSWIFTNTSHVPIFHLNIGAVSGRQRAKRQRKIFIEAKSMSLYTNKLWKHIFVQVKLPKQT